MQLTRQADYAMRAVLYLATTPLASIKEIAAAQRVPQEYLGKILQKLAKSGIVTTHRGVGGGISLARPPREITLKDVIEAVEGPLLINTCFIRPGECPREELCSIHDELEDVQRELSRLLSRTDFAQLARSEAAKQS